MEKRDDFRRMLRDCKKALINRIIVKSMSRFARNTEEMLTALRTLEQMEVSVYFEEQGIDTKSMNSEMFAAFPGMVAQQESVSISQNMRWSYKKRMESGEFNCCAPAYGFDLLNGKLVINETEAAVIRRIFSLYLQGMGMQSIANLLNDEGVGKRYGREKWHHTTVNYVLNNERYMGDALLQKQITTQTLPFKKQRNHGEQPMYYVENSNPAIVSRETYEAVQALIKSRQPSCKRKAKNYPLAKTLLCPDCGHTFRRQVVNGTAYWLCAAKATNKTDCAWRRVKENEVYAAFNLMIRKLSANREYLLGTLIRQLEELQYRTTGSQQRIKEIDREIADLTAQNLVLSRLHGKGVLNAADYTAQSDVLENKSSQYALSELLICGECRTPYRRCTWTAKGKKKIVWRCINRLDYGKKYCHHSPSIEESLLQDAVMRAIMQTAKQNVEVLKTLKIHIGMGLTDEISEDKALDIQIRIAEIDAEFQKMLKAVSADNADGIDEERITKLMNEKQRLTVQLEQYAAVRQKRESAKSRLDEMG